MIILKSLGLAFLCALMFSICDTLAANWAKNDSRSSLVGVFLLGPIGYLLFGYMNTFRDLAVVGGLVNALIVLMTEIAGVYIFGEADLSRLQISGLALIIVGVIFVSWPA